VNCDLLVINKTDLAPHVGVDLDTLDADSRAVRDGPFVFTDCLSNDGIDDVLAHIQEGVLFA
jgi:urease accessory protein